MIARRVIRVAVLRKGSVVMAMMLSWFGVASRAQDRAPIAREGLSLQQAIARALDREPGLRATRVDVEVARGTLTQMSLKPNPMLSFVRQEQPGGTDNQTTVTFEWPLELFRADGRVLVAEREVEATEFRVADRERLLVAEVRTAYGAALTATRDLEILDEIAAATARQYDLARGRVEEGAAPPIERDVLAVERRRIDADRVLQAARADAAMMTVKRLLGLAPAETVVLSDTFEALTELNAEPSAEADAAVVLLRADVREAGASVRVAEAAVDRARRDGRYDVSIFGAYTRMKTGFPQLGFAPGGGLQPVGDVFHYLSAGATLTIPWRNDNRGEIAAAEARYAGAEAQREAVDLRARTEAAAASILDRQARAAVAVYATDVRPLARQNVEVVRQTYELGRGTVAEVLNEQRRYLDIERAYTLALKEAYDARTSLLSALGVHP